MHKESPVAGEEGEGAGSDALVERDDGHVVGVTSILLHAPPVRLRVVRVLQTERHRCERVVCSTNASCD